ncbi:MAG TPA: argininosuccinate lyase [Armatimonadetes bacterium]|nr:argininosuccinate lyase [Armatimonadota bacterium]
MRTLWSHGEERPAEVLAEEWGASFAFDARLLPYDVRGSIAHARMLGATGIITPEESARIVAGLEEILREWEADPTVPVTEYEDVHTYVEARLTEKIGETARKLHTARSRNDQVALDARLFVKDAAGEVRAGIRHFQQVLVERAEELADVILPGYTHLQHAQPVSLGHHLMAYFWMIERDYTRFGGVIDRADWMPLGAGALAGTTFPINRQQVARELGFSRVAPNSLDAVSDRDFIIEFVSASALLMVHLSRLCEELILWTSREFGFCRLDDAFTTGSSMMPQKRNPDLAELIRGKSGRVTGSLVSLLMMVKGLPLAYNKDMQEDKEPLFDAADTARGCLKVMAAMIQTARFNRDRLAAATRGDFSTATDLADYLVRKGLPFRDAHDVSRRIVMACLEQGRALEDLSLDELRAYSPLFAEDALLEVSPERSAARRTSEGGTAPERVREQIALARELLGGV